ncbi:PIG-L family deacetylase, partial [Actinocorallia lasiicapitis]
LLTVYDPAGGYGHPDHVQVHRVGVEAARLAGTPLVLEATADRDRILRWLRPLLWAPPLSKWRRAYTPSSKITHRVDVRPHARAKRASMAAHATQAGGGLRTLGVCRRLPLPLFRAMFGTEYYVRRPPCG